jgi:hypothetical protein
LQTVSFADTINRARAAVTSRATSTSTAPAAPTSLTRWQGQTRRENAARAAELPVTALPRARAALDLPTPTVRPTSSARCPDLADVVNLADELRAGPARLLEALHRLAVHVVSVRGYACCPNQVTYHLSQELLALSLGCTTRSVQKWQAELERVGLLDTRAHYGGRKTDARVDGLVLAVTLKPGHRARLHHDELAHKWRDLDADRQAGKTAWAALKYLRSQSSTALEPRMNQVLKTWAVTSSFSKPRYFTDYERAENTVLDVVYTLPLLTDCPPRERPALVGRLAAALAHSLNDHHSSAWYARLIWDALEAEQSGLAALQPLASLLARLWADCREWPELRRPGALLAARLKPTS